MEWSEILQPVLAALAAVLVPIIPLGAAWLKAYISAQIDLLKSKNEQSYFNYHLDRAKELICDVVEELNQVYKEGLKQDGVFTKEKQLELLELAKRKVLDQITIQTKDVLQKSYNDYVAWIQTQIEKYVNELK